MTSFRALCALLLLLFSACATATGYYDNKPAGPAITLDRQAIMADHPCGKLAFSASDDVNNAPGWVKGAAPAGIDPAMSCGAKYNPPFYCSGAGCQTLVYKSLPGEKDRGKPWGLVADLLQGDVLACADSCNKFGWSMDHEHGLDCQFMPYSATARAPIRIAITATVPADPKTSPAMCLYVKSNPAHPGPIALGQVGTAQAPSP
jgi:hypothetical protein